MVTERRPKRKRRARKRKPKPSGRKTYMARHGEQITVDQPSEISVHIRHGNGRRIWLEVVPIDPNGPQDDRKPA